MRCKKHYTDLSSTVGVCATCLRQRLSAILAAQAQLQAHKPAQDDSWKSETTQHQQQQQQPVSFPRSVSPYISRRKSDTTTASASATRKQNQLFYSTPQLGVTVEIKNSGQKSSRGRSISSLIWGFFRSKTIKPDKDPNTNPDHVISVDNVRASPSWYSTMIGGPRKKQSRTFSIDETIAIGKACMNRQRGMSPNEEHVHGGLSGYSSESEGWKQTPRQTPASARRCGGRSATGGHSKNVSGFAFCLSPMVRASPNTQRNQKGMTPETMSNGEARIPAKPHLSYAASFCKNRSRKLADFGRYNYNSNY